MDGLALGRSVGDCIQAAMGKKPASKKAGGPVHAAPKLPLNGEF